MFGLSPAMTGAVIGLALGLFNYVILRTVSGSLGEKQGTVQREGGTGSVLRVAALADLVIFPIAGYAIGHFFFTPAT